MAFGLTPTGLIIKPLETMLAEVEAEQRAGPGMEGLDLSARSVGGQFNATLLAQLFEVWQALEGVNDAGNPDAANDDSLDNVSALTGTSRDQPTKTTIEDVDVTLNAGITLPVGSVAHIANQPTQRFLSVTEVTADVLSAETLQTDFIAETAGEVVAAANQLTVIAETVTGWTAVNNPIAGLTGTDLETDEQLRVKRLLELALGGCATIDSLFANLSDTLNVTDVRVIANDSNVDVGSLGPHTIRCVVKGGTIEDVAQTIFDTKAAGIETFGTESVQVTDSQGFFQEINFDRPVPVSFHAEVTVLTDNKFPADGAALVQQAISDYANGLSLGATVVYQAVQCAPLSVTGVIKVTALTIGFASSPTGMTDLPTDIADDVTSDTGDVIVTVTP